MLISRPVLDELAARLRRTPSGLSVASIEVDIDPLDFVRAGAPAFGAAMFVGSPDGIAVGALGAASHFEASGTHRFAMLRQSLRDLPENATAMVGFAFDPEGPETDDWSSFPRSLAVVPQFSVIRRAGRSTLSVAISPGIDPAAALALCGSLRAPGPPEAPRAVSTTLTSVPPVAEWSSTVAEAVGAIEGGAVEKVVLARTVRVNLGNPIQAFDVVGLLRDRYPECRVFGWQTGESTFVGASPELLISRTGARFRTVALAGSAPRSPNPDLDRRLADALLASEKDGAEHAIVVDEIVRRLAPHAEVIDFPSAPVVERYATVQHLSTPIVGRTRRGATALDLAEAIHPTPAVGGHPSSEAAGFLHKLEQIDRGWYAGGIGWIDAAGDGEMAVALRCALIRGEHAVLYAGNGIVAGSDPEDEVEETRLKLRPLLDLLTGA